MNTPPRSARLHIAILGRCNTGKSTILNLIAGQHSAIVSAQPGTTADPVSVPFELPILGPVNFYDTAGMDEIGSLGLLRQASSRKVLARADIAVIVTDSQGIGECERDIMDQLRLLRTPFFLVFNKRDLGLPPPADLTLCREEDIKHIVLSANADSDPTPLREALIKLAPEIEEETPLIADVLPAGAAAVCVIPIDASVPKGRLILPQVQVLRELVENGNTAIAVHPSALTPTLALMRKEPDIVICDSQVVREVAVALPPTIPLTTFSIIVARQKGDFALMANGAQAISTLPAGAHVLIAEACSHHPGHDDIARVKIPALLQRYLGHTLHFSFCSGVDFPEDIARYSLVLHCGGCMLTRREMCRRLRMTTAAGVPVSNYGMAISLSQGILERALRPFNLPRAGSSLS